MKRIFTPLLATVFVLLCWMETAVAQTVDSLCKGVGELGHQRQFWGASFPYTGNKVASVCDGKVTVKDDGRICVNSQASYGDIRVAVSDPILAPSNDGVTVAGHMLSGSPHWWRGTELTHAIDYVTSYTVNGTEYQADDKINDRLFAASRGTIDRICFDSSFAKKEYYYSISHNLWPQGFGLVNKTRLLEGQFLIISNLFVLGEYLKEVETPLVDYGTWLLTIQGFFASSVFGGGGSSTATAGNEDTSGTNGGFLGLFPVTMNSFAPLGRVWVNGPTSSALHPSPTIGTSIESIQIDTEWETLVAALEDGLFTEYGRPPKEIYVAIKRLEPGSDNPIGCWRSTAADLSFGGERGKGKLIDDYVNNVVYPVLARIGTVGMHVGKRIPAGAEVTKAALKRYNEVCGVQIDIEPENCYHPLCRRTATPTNFTYPPQYYVSTSAL